MADPTIDEVDAFIAGFKTLDGMLSEWEQRWGWDWQAQWGLLDVQGRQTGELKFSINAALTRPTIVATFRRKLIYRVDIVEKSDCKYNDLSAQELGLPPIVCGPHSHPWAENRKFVELNGFGELPVRKPVSIADTKIIRALEVTAADLNIHVEPRQRDVELPRQATLFAERTSL